VIYVRHGESTSAIGKGLISQVVYGSKLPNVTSCADIVNGSDVTVHGPEVNLPAITVEAEVKVPPIELPPAPPITVYAPSQPITVPTPIVIANVPQTATTINPDTKVVTTTLVDFNSHLYVNGVEIPPPSDDFRYVVIPFYGKVEDVHDNDENVYFNNVFNYYHRRGGQESHGQMLGYLNPVLKTLQAKIEKQGCYIALDVIGYASTKEFNHLPKLANLVLAEARRAVVLKAMGLTYAPEDSGRVEEGPRLQILNLPATKNGELLDPKLQAWERTIEWPVRFNSYEEMHSGPYGLSRWFEQADGDPVEALSRSVVLMIQSKDLAGCRTDPDVNADATLPGGVSPTDKDTLATEASLRD
jgi:hypothetical protein